LIQMFNLSTALHQIQWEAELASATLLVGHH
jgi:hypothetical protein